MIYLGFDASTQSLTAMLIEAGPGPARLICERSFAYDEALPGYRTSHGVIRGADPLVVVAPPLMWADALDHMIALLVREWPSEMAHLAAISGSAQQHGTVYLNESARPSLALLNPAVSLAPQLGEIFSRPVSPVWMDSSTTAECREIAAAVGGDDVLARRTGSRAYERFAGPQIRKFWRHQPEAYAETTRVHLISSFLASLLACADAPVDSGDGSGMSLMDLASSDWWPPAVEATAPDLGRRLPHVAASSSIAGTLGPYWRTRYGLPPARVVTWSGDNTCSLIGVGLVREGLLAISLGTSDTLFGLMREPRVSADGTGHVFGAPTGDFMGITVFKNGSLARERVRDAYGLDWGGFSHALRSTPAGNGGALMLPWFDPEITPHVTTPGVRRQHLDASSAAANVRAVIEAQMMAMANHSAWMGVHVSTIHATGGAAANTEILQVMADVFNADVYRFTTTNSACLGAALRAWHADALASGRPIAWNQIVSGIAEPKAKDKIAPEASHAEVYQRLRREYGDFEESCVG